LGGVSGATGAFFSIAIAIRQRTVLVDLRFWSNLQDALLRIVIGIIAAMILVMLIQSGAIHFEIGEAKFAEDSAFKSWIYVLLTGFLGGFSERLVPDMLDKLSNESGPASGTATKKIPSTASAAVAAVLPSGPAAPSPPEATVPPSSGSPESEDHCMSDKPFPASLITPDDALPAATGGVAAPRQ
jgi:hypothetical protein